MNKSWFKKKKDVGGDVHFLAIGSLRIHTRRERSWENGLEFTLGFKEGKTIFHKILVTLAPFLWNELTATKKQECLTLCDRSLWLSPSSLFLCLCVCAHTHAIQWNHATLNSPSFCLSLHCYSSQLHLSHRAVTTTSTLLHSCCNFGLQGNW